MTIKSNAFEDYFSLRKMSQNSLILLKCCFISTLQVFTCKMLTFNMSYMELCGQSGLVVYCHKLQRKMRLCKTVRSNWIICRFTHTRPTVLTLQLVIVADMLMLRITASSQNFKSTNSLIFKA